MMKFKEMGALWIAIWLIALMIGAGYVRDYVDPAPARPNTEEQITATTNKILAGEEISVNELNQLHQLMQYSRVGEQWCDRHNIPKEERVAKIQELIRIMDNTKIRIILPDQSEGESSS